MIPCPPPPLGDRGLDGITELCRRCGHIFVLHAGRWWPTPYDRGGP